MEYTSHAVGNAALTTGIVGTALGAINSMGGLANIFGIAPKQSSDPGDRPVTRYEMSLIQANNDKDIEIATLKAQKYADGLAAGIQAEIGQQAVWNATQQGVIGCLQNQIAQLQGMTQMMIPNKNIAPGWGPVDVVKVADATASTGTGN